MKGRILKIKTGYNPNSSSIGVDMIVFFTAGAAITVLFNTIASILCATQARKCGKAEESGKAAVLGRMEEQK